MNQPQVGTYVTQLQSEYLRPYLPPEQMNVIVPLHLIMECTATKEEMNENVAATLERGYAPIAPHLGTASGTVSLCGAGPSLGEHIGEIRGDVFAVNSAIKYLLDHGVVPRWAMIWDCDPVCEQFAVPHPDITYLIGSRCHPKVFERLRDCKVAVWHADGDHNIVQFLQERSVNEPLIMGGTTGITRGIYVAYALGYRDFHLFGADSSYAEDGRSHVVSSVVKEHVLEVMVGGKWFKTTAQWAAQIEEMKVLYPMFKHTELKADDMTVYGDGMLAHVMRIMKSDEELAFNVALSILAQRHQQKIQPLGEVTA